MSGSDPQPGPRPRPMGDNGGGPDCPGLKLLATLASPDPDGVDSLEAGDILDVALIEEGGVTIIGVVRSEGTVIGSVVSDRAAQLRECLQQGFTYGAKVDSVVGGAVRVWVSARE